jgi:uncharacterized phage-associated protein
MVDLIAPKHAADFLLVESREQGELLTNLKLQKLLYYAQARGGIPMDEPSTATIAKATTRDYCRSLGNQED